MRIFTTLALLTLALSVTGRAATYSIDSGTAATSLGDNTAGWSAATLNHFTATAGAQTITAISVVFGNPGANSNLAGGENFTVVLWSDPDGNGNPSDAVVLASATGNMSLFNSPTSAAQSTAISPVTLAVGQSFFAGVVYNNYGANILPAGVAPSGAPGDSWLAYNVPGGGNINVSNLAGSNAFGTLASVVPAAAGLAAMVRAEAVPEPGVAALSGLALITGLSRRRRTSAGA